VECKDVFILDAIGSGTGILLAVTIIYQCMSQKEYFCCRHHGLFIYNFVDFEMFVKEQMELGGIDM
jgi:hypothetical protein